VFDHGDDLAEIYSKASKFLELELIHQIGVTILLGYNWMLIAPLTDPVSSIDDLPLFIDALAYVGIMNINIEHPIWP